MSDKRLLAIDDDEAFRDFLGSVMAETDYRSVITGDAGEFKRVYHELDPTVVLLDMLECRRCRSRAVAEQ